MKNLLSKLRARTGGEDGVAILLTVMIVSGLAIISVTVAFFVMQEVRNARSSALTEPAIVAAESAGEQGLYQAKRSSFSASCGSASYTQLDGTTTGGSTNTRIKKCVSTQPAVFQVTAANPLTFMLYDPINVNTNTCLEQTCPDPYVAFPLTDDDGLGSGPQLYTSLVVTHMSGTTNVAVDIDTLDGVDYASGTVTPGNSGTYPIIADIPSSRDERLTVTLTPSSGTVTVQVSTTGLYTGLPDYQTIDAEGCVGVVNITGCDTSDEIYKRRINVTLPR